MSQNKKVPISQRWEKQFLETIRETARQYETSMTQLTIEALELYVKLADRKQFIQTKPQNRKELLHEAALNYLDSEGFSESEEIDVSQIKDKGFIRDQVMELLQLKQGYQFSTTEISEILDIPQSTARTYVRELAEQSDYQLYEGRPNKIQYTPGSNS